MSVMQSFLITHVLLSVAQAQGLNTFLIIKKYGIEMSMRRGWKDNHAALRAEPKGEKG